MAEKQAYQKRTKEPLTANVFGKLPPQAMELEEAVLGALMVESTAFDTISGLLKADCFYKVSHQHIFRAISDLSSRNEPTDMMMVVEELRKSGNIDDVGGPYFITQLTAKINSAAHIEFHSRIILQKYMARELIRVSSLIQSKAFNDETDVDDLMTEAESMFSDIGSFLAKNGELAHISEALKQASDDYAKRIDQTSKGLTTGVTTGLFELNKLLGGGWQKSTLNIIAARPAMGKTALMLSYAKAAAREGNHVCIFSLEMSSVSLVNRLILAEAYTDEDHQLKADRFNLGYANEKEWALFEAAKARLEALPIYIDDTAMVDFRHIKNRSKAMKKQGKCDIILIDYLQLTDMDDANKTRNREQEISKTTRQFKILSKELDVPVILLSQLNRGVEARPDKKPLLSDLRESGAIEQDADTVQFIYRPAYYKIEQTEDGKSTMNLGYVNIAKHRNGALGEIAFTHNSSMTKIWDYYEGEIPMETGYNTYGTPDYKNDVPF